MQTELHVMLNLHLDMANIFYVKRYFMLSSFMLMKFNCIKIIPMFNNTEPGTLHSSCSEIYNLRQTTRL